MYIYIVRAKHQAKAKARGEGEGEGAVIASGFGDLEIKGRDAGEDQGGQRCVRGE